MVVNCTYVPNHCVNYYCKRNTLLQFRKKTLDGNRQTINANNIVPSGAKLNPYRQLIPWSNITNAIIIIALKSVTHQICQLVDYFTKKCILR